MSAMLLKEVDKLVPQEANVKKFCVGHSLGGHVITKENTDRGFPHLILFQYSPQVCSFLGKSYRQSELPEGTNSLDFDELGEGEMPAALDGIVALDPAGPIFNGNSDYATDAPLGARLGSRDAKVDLYNDVQNSNH